MKLMILSCVHGLNNQRQFIYDFFLRRMSHIKDKFATETLVVGSEGDLSREMTEDAGLRYLEHQNKPVSNKWNAGMEAIREYSPDYVMIMGSDDLICDRLMERYLEEIADGKMDLFGIQDSYFYGLNPKGANFNVCIHWPGYPGGALMGAAKCYSNRVMDMVGWRPWLNGKNAGLDFSVTKVFNAHNVDRSKLRGTRINIKENGYLHIDIKSRGNISSISPLKRRSTVVDIEELLYKHLPADEVDYILAYRDSEIVRRNAKVK